MQTPYYLYDFDEISSRYERIRSAFSGASFNVFYAIKANSNLSLLKHLATLGSGFDCVSANEIRRALYAGAVPYKIIYSGVGKSKDEINFALDSKILYINAESQAELELIEAIAKERNQIANISLRINPNIDAKTHPYISTGLSENKFGIDMQTAKILYLKAHKSPHLNPIAAHFHIGSQLLDLSPIIEAAKLVRKLISELNAAGLDIRFFDIGGGIGVAYEPNEIEPDIKPFAAEIKAIANGLSICAEPGRFLVAPAGKLITSVLYEKRSETKRFIIVDASMAELMRPSLYGAFHEVEFTSDKLGEYSLADVVGGVCESGDFLAKNVLLPALKPGDLISIKNAGAYGFSMSSNYNSRTKIAEFALINGKLKQIARAQSFDELIATEIDYL